jgi:hypothetical protein
MVSKLPAEASRNAACVAEVSRPAVLLSLARLGFPSAPSKMKQIEKAIKTAIGKGRLKLFTSLMLPSSGNKNQKTYQVSILK